ncbi:MAG: nucleotidyltransferase family protein [Puniceicoccaceae bacterium]
MSETADRVAGRPVHVSVFGSRVRDEAKGGDLDLLVESTPALNTLEKSRLVSQLEDRLMIPVDVISAEPGPSDRAIVAIAKGTGVTIEK